MHQPTPAKIASTSLSRTWPSGSVTTAQELGLGLAIAHRENRGQTTVFTLLDKRARREFIPHRWSLNQFAAKVVSFKK